MPFNFTPGPWAVSRNLASVVGHDGTTLTPVEMGSLGILDILDQTPNAAANARLIAAAPLLVAGCSEARALIDSLLGMIEVVADPNAVVADPNALPLLRYADSVQRRLAIALTAARGDFYPDA